MKILMGPANIAQQPMLLRKELRERGIEVDFVQYITVPVEQYPNKYGYPQDTLYQLSQLKNRLKSQLDFLAQCFDKDYDIYNFWMRSLVHGSGPPGFGEAGLDIPLIKARGKRVVYRFTGMDARQESMNRTFDRFNVFAYGYSSMIDEDCQVKYINFLREYVDQFVVASIDLQEYVPEAMIIPRIAELDKLDFVGVQHTVEPVVVHVPSDRQTKGTPIIEEAVANLRKNGVKFRFVMPDKTVTHAELLDLYREADIVIDQICIGDYGVASVEAMALGKPVVVYLRPTVANSAQIPVFNANPETLEHELEAIIDNYPRRQELSIAGREYVERVHSPGPIADLWEELFLRVLRLPPIMPTGTRDLDWFMYQYELLEDKQSAEGKLSYKISYAIAVVKEMRLRTAITKWIRISHPKLFSILRKINWRRVGR